MIPIGGGLPLAMMMMMMMMMMIGLFS